MRRDCGRFARSPSVPGFGMVGLRTRLLLEGVQEGEMDRRWSIPAEETTTLGRLAIYQYHLKIVSVIPVDKISFRSRLRDRTDENQLDPHLWFLQIQKHTTTGTTSAFHGDLPESSPADSEHHSASVDSLLQRISGLEETHNTRCRSE
jgi:hypothetical protein